MKIFNHAGKKMFHCRSMELIYSNLMKMLLQIFCCSPEVIKQMIIWFFPLVWYFQEHSETLLHPFLWHYHVRAKSNAYFSFSLRTFCPKKNQIITITVDWDQNIIIEHWELSLLYTTLNKQVVLHFNYHTLYVCGLISVPSGSLYLVIMSLQYV